jgi:hypothetical protein
MVVLYLLVQKKFEYAEIRDVGLYGHKWELLTGRSPDKE